MIETDASMYTQGATLLQQQDLCDHHKMETIGYYINALFDTEMRYLATERELLSVVWSLRTLRPYFEAT